MPTLTQQVQPELNANKGCDYKVLKKWKKRQTNRKKMKQGLLFQRDGFWEVRAHRGKLRFPCASVCVYMSISPSGLTSPHHTHKTVNTKSAQTNHSCINTDLDRWQLTRKVIKYTHTHTHTLTHTLSLTHTHTHTHSLTLSLSHTHTHTHTHTHLLSYPVRTSHRCLLQT